MDDTPDLSLLATMLRQMIADQMALRDDIRVLTASAMRQDKTLAAMLTELRAMHSRMDARVRAIGSPQPGAH